LKEFPDDNENCKTKKKMKNIALVGKKSLWRKEKVSFSHNDFYGWFATTRRILLLFDKGLK